MPGTVPEIFHDDVDGNFWLQNAELRRHIGNHSTRQLKRCRLLHPACDFIGRLVISQLNPQRIRAVLLSYAGMEMCESAAIRRSWQRHDALLCPLYRK